MGTTSSTRASTRCSTSADSSLGFALLAKFFEHSGVPDNLPRLLPKSKLWGGFALLAIVWVISSFLDNIAAAMIGGVIARTAYKGRVSVGYVAAIVAASNAGGAWSVLGDTTTTMMWIDGVGAIDVAHGFVASVVGLVVSGSHRDVVPEQDPADRGRRARPRGSRSTGHSS